MNVEFFRNICGCTQNEFADLLQISKQAYSRKENGFVEFRDGEKQVILDKILEVVPNATITDIFFDKKLRKVLYLDKGGEKR